MNILYTGCSMKGAILLHLWRTTENYQNKFVFHLECVHREKLKWAIMIKTLCIYKELYTGHFMREALSLSLTKSTYNSWKKEVLQVGWKWIGSDKLNQQKRSGYEALRISLSFAQGIWMSSDKLKSANQINTFHTFKMLYRECSTYIYCIFIQCHRFSRGSPRWNFDKKWQIKAKKL